MDIEKAQNIIDLVENTPAENSSNSDIVEAATNNQETDHNTTNNQDQKNANNTSKVPKQLKPYNNTDNVLSNYEAVKRGRAGGIKSGETRRKRKTAQELLAKMLATNLSDDQISEILGNADNILNEDRSVYNVMLARMVQQAMQGSEKAFIALRDTAGDKPAERTELTAEVITDQDRKQIDKMRKQLLDISKIG